MAPAYGYEDVMMSQRFPVVSARRLVIFYRFFFSVNGSFWYNAQGAAFKYCTISFLMVQWFLALARLRRLDDWSKCTKGDCYR